MSRQLIFTKGAGKHDRMDVVVEGVCTCNVQCPKQGIIPHDMIHFAVESTLQRRGFITRTLEGDTSGFRMTSNVESDGVEEALLKVAESYVQLLTPTRDDSTVAKWLNTRGGPGIHHVGYRVANCAEALDAVKAQGFRVLDDAPRPGSRGTTVAFIHPKDALGTLIELVQE